MSIIAVSPPLCDLGDIPYKLLPYLYEKTPGNESATIKSEARKLLALATLGHSWHMIVEKSISELNSKNLRAQCQALQTENTRLAEENARLNELVQRVTQQQDALIEVNQGLVNEINGLARGRNEALFDLNKGMFEKQKIANLLLYTVISMPLVIVGVYGHAIENIWLENMPLFIAACAMVTVHKKLSASIFLCGCCGLYGASMGNMWAKHGLTCVFGIPAAYFLTRFTLDYTKAPEQQPHED